MPMGHMRTAGLSPGPYRHRKPVNYGSIWFTHLQLQVCTKTHLVQCRYAEITSSVNLCSLIAICVVLLPLTATPGQSLFINRDLRGPFALDLDSWPPPRFPGGLVPVNRHFPAISRRNGSIPSSPPPRFPGGVTPFHRTPTGVLATGTPVDI
jgi:hypothetical protein